MKLLIYLCLIKTELFLLVLIKGPKEVSYIDFVKEGWRRADGKKTAIEQTIEAKEVELWPQETVMKSVSKEIEKLK